MGSKSRKASRMGWQEICHSNQYRGRWVALDNVRYDPATSVPLEADVVDVDEDLGDLCARMRSADRTACAILHCDEHGHYQPIPQRRPVQPAPHPRAAQH
jgi:hypothetical protein